MSSLPQFSQNNFAIHQIFGASQGDEFDFHHSLTHKEYNLQREASQKAKTEYTAQISSEKSDVKSDSHNLGKLVKAEIDLFLLLPGMLQRKSLNLIGDES